MTDTRFIHMTMTKPTLDGRWMVLCRCTWRSWETYRTKNEALTAGDAHLAERNRQ